MNIDQKYQNQIIRLKRLKKIYTNIFLSFWMWFILTGLVLGVFISLTYGAKIIKMPDWATIATLIMIALIGFGIPVMFLIKNPYYSYSEKLIDMLIEDGIDANMLYDFGTRNGIDGIYNKALELRLKELGTTVVPSWCVRDGVLPTIEDIKKAEQKSEI